MIGGAGWAFRWGVGQAGEQMPISARDLGLAGLELEEHQLDGPGCRW